MSDLPERSFAAAVINDAALPDFCSYADWKYPGVPQSHDCLYRTHSRDAHTTTKTSYAGDCVNNDVRPCPLPLVIHSACCEVVRVIGDLRLDPVTIE